MICFILKLLLTRVSPKKFFIVKHLDLRETHNHRFNRYMYYLLKEKILVCCLLRDHCVFLSFLE